VAAAQSVSPTSLEFGPQAIGTSSAAQAVTFTNSSSSSLISFSITVSGSNPNHAGDFRPTTTCGIILVPGASCTIAVTFVPSETGARAEILTIDSTGGGGPLLTVQLSGTGTPVELQLLSQSMVEFGVQGAGVPTAAQSITLTNLLSWDLTGIKFTISGANAADFAATTTCSTVLWANASCTLSVVFTPAGAGARSAALTFSSDISGSFETVQLSGSGIVS
jgi:hypothetical protein